MRAPAGVPGGAVEAGCVWGGQAGRGAVLGRVLSGEGLGGCGGCLWVGGVYWGRVGVG